MTDVSVEKTPTELRLLSILFAVAAVTYLLWWFAVVWLLPGSFNPLADRLAVVALFGGGWVAACTRRFSPDALRVYFGACAWILTSHYSYLFQGNRARRSPWCGCVFRSPCAPSARSARTVGEWRTCCSGSTGRRIGSSGSWRRCSIPPRPRRASSRSDWSASTWAPSCGNASISSP